VVERHASGSTAPKNKTTCRSAAGSFDHVAVEETMRTNTLLWIVQGALAALFLCAGVSKLVLPVEAMAGPLGLPGGFLRFIGVAESLGAIGLVVPWLTRIRPELTPLAACGLVVIMMGAVVVTATGMSTIAASMPLVVGLLAATVAYGRGRQLLASRSALVAG
jgi:hypothetical protein